MKDVRPLTDITNRTHVRSSQWYQAATLSERVPLLSQHCSHSTSSTPSEHALQRLHRWKDQAPFQRSSSYFSQRLDEVGATEEMLLTLLDQSEEDLSALFTTQPPWLDALFLSFNHSDTSNLSVPSASQTYDQQALLFLQPVRPLLKQGFSRLHAGIDGLKKTYTSLPFDDQNIDSLLLPHIFKQMVSKMTRTVVLELNVARVQGHLSGETPEERFAHFLHQLAEPECMLTLLEEYPVLARILVEMVERWVDSTLELLNRLCSDWDEIRATFAPDKDPGQLTEIQEGAGDKHQRGRSVTILTWKSGLRLVYKPRSLAIDSQFQYLLTWLNAHGCQPAFRPCTLLAKGSYGWCEFVSATSCTSSAEIERFYQRLGGYVALLYALEATDFHAQNMISSGEHPMMVDLEALFHPRIEKYDTVTHYGYEALQHSVQRVGLLPQRVWSNKEAAGIDVSGLSGKQGQLTPFLVTTWTGEGTDQMQLTRGRVEIEIDDNRPRLDEQAIDVLEYSQSVITGFATVYRLLLSHREEFLMTVLPRFSNAEVRVLVRQTQNYVMLQTESLHPNMLRDSLDRERIFDRLWTGIEHKPYLARVIADERADLLNEDIPKFTTTPASHNLITSRGEIIPDFLQQSSLDLTKKCIQELSEADLERQSWVIQASFATLALDVPHTMRKNGLQLQSARALAGQVQLLKEASAIGDRLRQLALIHEDLVSWLGVILVNGYEWHILPAGQDLYDGLSGMALFLAYLGMLTDRTDFSDLARLTLDTVRTQLTYLGKQRGVGGFDGAGAWIYLLSHLGAIWNDPTLYEEAEKLVAQLPTMVDEDESFDVISGSAGCIAALLSLYSVAPSPAILTAAIYCGDHLLQHAQPMFQGIAWKTKHLAAPLAGIAHGNAGIALNLLRLAAVSKETRFHEAALAAMEYERGLFSPERRNWPDLRKVTSPVDLTQSNALAQQNLSYMVAWCHGASGIAMARLASLSYIDDEAINAEIEAAFATTLSEGFGRNHSLCHGDMGNLEVLVLATLLRPDLCSNSLLLSLQSSLLENMHAQGWQTGLPVSVETPGLMTGLTGTGYELLRLADSQKVPSLLLLDPPSIGRAI